ncbi:MAG TPA: LuxR C-terminal-related transcriptional regulator [Dehalococcoidia bacterium]|nr:LuxR C-terminal-related transcriptional regulator [Dehalococcoidia bacterium]
MADEQAAFGELLRRYRERACLTQEALAERAELTASAIIALERGRRRYPYPHTVRRLGEALALSEAELTAFGIATRPARPEQRGETVAPAAAVRPSNLPAMRTSLIGREQEIASLSRLVVEHPGRLLTLTGIGGGGKTRLALAIAAAVGDAFPDGVWLAELASVAEPSLVPQALAVALDVPDVAGVPLADTLVKALQDRSLLLVLDNCEHLIDACADLAERLLAACPGLRLLATSREPLQVAGEQVVRVPPLAAPDHDTPVTPAVLTQSPAVQLFVERAQTVEAGFRLTAENAAVVQICATLNGIPLALELAAARVRVLSAAQIVERLDDSLRLLTGNSRAAPGRQQTLRAALDWSHALLPAAEQTLFRRLAVFAGGLDLEAAEAVGGGSDLPDADVLDLLTQLVDKSLLQLEPDSAPARYRLLEPVRQYALQRLEASGDAEAAEACHAGFYRALAERGAPELRGGDQVAWLARLDRERDNLRAALRWLTAHHDAVSGLRLAGALVRFWEGRGYVSEGRQWLETVLSVPAVGAAPATLRAGALLGAGALAEWQGDLDAAEPLFEQSLALARATRDPGAIAWARAWLGVVYGSRADFPRAVSHLEESLRRFMALRDRAGTAFALVTLGTGLALKGDAAESRLLLRESLELFHALGDTRYVAIANTMLGYAEMLLGDTAHAAALVAEGLGGLSAVGDRLCLVYGLLDMAAIEYRRKRHSGTARLIGAAEVLREPLGRQLAADSVVQYDRLIAALHRHHSDAEFDAAWAAGRALTPAQAVAEALAGAQSAAPMPAPAAAPPGDRAREPLTPREQRDARLLAQGRSDRQIAAALAISPRTVGVHVQHVLAKLGLRSRWQIAAAPGATEAPDGA